MGFYLKLARRNIFRNRRRTFLTGLIIGVGLAAMMFTDAWIIGMKENLISSATSSFVGHAQVHREGFTELFDGELTIRGREELLRRLQEDPEIAETTRRVVSYGTISSPADVASVVVYGIDPATEPSLSQIDESLTEGAYLENANQNGALIGVELAEELEAAVGSRIVVTLSEAESGSISQQLLRVSGVYQTHIERFDEGVVLVPLGVAQEMMGLGSEIHEIALRFQEPRYAQESGETFASKYSENGNVAEPWPELLPQIRYILDMTDVSTGMTAIIVFAMIVFGIMNTLFMSLYERVFEFGVLRAAGTRAGVLRKLIVFEAGALAVYSMVVGMVLGSIVIALGSVYGMDLTGVELAGTSFTGRIYTAFSLRQFTLHPLLVFGFTVLMSLYPANHAAKMSIARALERAL
jgi:ABC-type lipoprotein release transport system permease subunit